MTEPLKTTRDYERAAGQTLVYLPKLIAEEFGCSSSEGRRLIAQGAVYVDGLQVLVRDMPRYLSEGKTLTVGKGRSVEL